MGFWVIVLVIFVVVLIYAEGKRQERALGEPASGRPSILGSALLEAQSLLEADRRVESMQEVLQNEDRVEGEHGQLSGDDPGCEPTEPTDPSKSTL